MLDSTKLLVFDIETVPDERHAETEEFAKPLFHKVVAVSYLRASVIGDGAFIAVDALKSASEPKQSECDLVEGILQLIEEMRPRLVTFNVTCPPKMSPFRG
jgi:hypothetical protein